MRSPTKRTAPCVTVMRASLTALRARNGNCSDCSIVKIRNFFVTGVALLTASQAFAQAPVERSLATPTGHDVSVGVSSYTYREPDGDTPIKIHAPKFVAEYIGTLSLSRQRHLFMQAQARSTFGNTTYNGWCSPFFIA